MESTMFSHRDAENRFRGKSESLLQSMPNLNEEIQEAWAFMDL